MAQGADGYGLLTLIATSAAVVVAPIIALAVGTILQKRRIHYERRYDVFRTLMAERANIVSPAAVKAMNLIDVEFKENRRVLDAWHEYYTTVNSAEFRNYQQPRQLEVGKRHFSQLLLEMVAALKVKEKFTLNDFDRGYLPLAIGQPLEQARLTAEAINKAIIEQGGVPVVIVNLPTPTQGSDSEALSGS